jgi:hypothetical protein
VGRGSAIFLEDVNTVFVSVQWYMELQKKSRSIKKFVSLHRLTKVGIFSSRDMHLTVIRLHDVTASVSSMGCHGAVTVGLVK